MNTRFLIGVYGGKILLGRSSSYRLIKLEKAGRAILRWTRGHWRVLLGHTPLFRRVAWALQDLLFLGALETGGGVSDRNVSLKLPIDHMTLKRDGEATFGKFIEFYSKIVL